MILYIRGFPATDLVKYDGSLDDSYLGIILVQLSTILKKLNKYYQVFCCYRREC